MKIRVPDSTSEHGVIAQQCENYHYYMVTLKPNFKSYIKRSIGNSEFMSNIFEIFMTNFASPYFKFVDAGIEYDSKNVCHIHCVLVSKTDVLKLNQDNCFSLSILLNFKRGIYVDLRTFPEADFDNVIQYINKGNKTNEILEYYRNNYGFVN